MRIRLCHDPEGIVDFLEAQKYPLFDMHKDRIHEFTTLAIETSNEDIIGYIWASWIPECDRILTLHTCLDKEYKGRWLNRKIIQDMVSFSRMMGAKKVMCCPIYSDVGDQLERMGFTKTPVGYIVDIN